MQTNTTSTESKTASTTTPTNSIPKPPGVVDSVPPVVDDGDNNNGKDDFGYEIVKEQTPPAGTTDDSTKTEEEKVKNPSTGYGKKLEETPPAKVDDKKPEEKKADEVPTTDEEKVKQELSEVVKALPDSFDKEVVTKFAVDNKFTKEQLDAYVKFATKTAADSEAKYKELVKTTRENWEKELKEDPEFGGEHFDHNLDRAEKVLEKYMVNTKKELTERGSMLPPYIMRDLHALSKVLNPKAPLVTGDPGAGPEDENDLDTFYK